MSVYSLEKKLELMETFIPDFEKLNSKISKVSVGWHLDHSLKVINGVINTLQTSDISLYKNNFTLIGKIFFTIGHFPKGRAKAPKRVMPPNVILRDDILSQINTAKERIHQISSLDDNAYFQHPIFGNINRKRVVRFLEIHTNHHLKIIKDILK